MKCYWAGNVNANKAKFDSLTAFIVCIVINGEEDRVGIFCLPFFHSAPSRSADGCCQCFMTNSNLSLLVKGLLITEKNPFLFSSMKVRERLVHFVLFPLVFVP